MILNSPSISTISLFGFDIYFYGLILAFAVFSGFYVAYYLFKKYYNEIFAEKFFDFSPLLLIGGIFGARLYYCILNYEYYFIHPIEILNLRQGGLSIHGMMIFGAISLFAMAKYYKINFFKLIDTFCCALPLAQSIGRWGNFFNSEAFGLPTSDSILKLYIAPNNRPIGFENFDFFHPTFLYESIFDLLIFLILFNLFKYFSKTPGNICSLYLICYGFIRYWIEQLRIDSALNIFNIPIAQIMSILMIIVGIFIFYIINKKNYLQ